MNLYDLVKRQDKFSEFQGENTVSELKLTKMRHRILSMAPNSVLKTRDAQQILCLQNRPHNSFLRAYANQSSFWRKPKLRILAKSEGQTWVLFESRKLSTRPESIQLSWPEDLKIPFDLIFENCGKSQVHIDCGPLFDSFGSIKEYILGQGVELGPGLAPRVLPAAKVDPTYLEITHPSEWQKLYPGAAIKDPQKFKELEGRYRIGTAYDLSTYPPASLDFIFSSHVMEHLMNPIGLLQYWRPFLAKNAIVAGVIPDCHFTFDYRQKPSTLSDWLAEYEAKSFTIPDEKYERWCNFTAPNKAPLILKDAGYSIHVQYYTPQNFEILSQHLKSIGLISEWKINAGVGNKDFAFLWRI